MDNYVQTSVLKLTIEFSMIGRNICFSQFSDMVVGRHTILLSADMMMTVRRP